MGAVLFALLVTVRDAVRHRVALHAELLALRHQLLVLQRQRGERRVRLRSADRLRWVVLSRLWSRWRDALILVKPETVIAWHRRGFRRYWRSQSRGRAPGRPPLSQEVVRLIETMHQANRTWGRHGFMGNCSSSASDWQSRRCRSICRGLSARPPRDGEPFSATICRR